MRVFRQQSTDRNGKTRESAKWDAEFRDANEKTQRLPGFTDKGQTVEFGRRVEKLVAVRMNGDVPPPDLAAWLERLPKGYRERLGRFGLLDSRTVANAKPLKEHLEDFEANLRHKGRTKGYCGQTMTRIRRIVDCCDIPRSN